MIAQIDNTEKPIQKVAVVDDDYTEAQVTKLLIEAAGFEAIIIPVDETFEEPSSLAKHIKKNAEAAVCDHRLTHQGFVNFYGASVVASLYDLGIPAVLVTQYIERDKDVSIRQWRHKIPVLLDRENADSESIRSGLQESSNELHGFIQPNRKPHKTIVRIIDVKNESGRDMVEAIVPSWDVKTPVKFPVSMLSEEIRRKIQRGVRLIADVNIGAETPNDLYFKNIELAPEPDPNDGLA